jgi:hypothetical protein
MGRPRINFRPEDYKRITELAAKGANQSRIASVLNISPRTFKNRLKDDRLASEAYELGLAEEEFALVGLLRAKAEKGDGPAAMFLLKTRHGYRETGVTDANDSTRIAVQINLPPSLSHEEFQKLVSQPVFSREADPT